MGHDRFLADLRPLLAEYLNARGLLTGMCCHAYDLCTELIAREAGVLVTDEFGGQLSAPLDLHTNVTWVGYANANLRDLIAPQLQSSMRRHGLSSQIEP